MVEELVLPMPREIILGRSIGSSSMYLQTNILYERK